MNHIKKNLEKDNEIEELAKREMVDKNSNGHWYSRWYNLYFEPLKNDEINLLEIGILGGGSHRMWRDYFTNGKVYAIDINPVTFKHDLSGIEAFLGDASDEIFLSSIISKITKGLDIIIDDASHRTSEQIRTFNYLFPVMNSGGIYVIEDLQTSYMEGYKIEPNNSAVDYLKEKIDDVNWRGKGFHQNYKKLDEDIKNNLNYWEKNIESMHFYAGICFIFKR
jgi:hypothetical protein